MNSVATLLGSLACTFALIAPTDNTLTNDWQEYEKPMNYDVQTALSENARQKTLSDYIKLCERLFAANTIMFQLFAAHQEYVEDTDFRQKLQIFVERLAMLCQKARERLEKDNILNPFDEKVLYSSLSLKTLIENLLDKDFMERIGVDDSLAEVNIVEFGKGIDEAERIDI